jgi:hypothetical protein
MNALLAFDQLVTLAPRLGITDAPCPLCSHMHNPRRRVLRIWRERGDFAGFACARCGEKGLARSGDNSARPSLERLAKIRSEAARRQAAEQAASLRKARWLLSASIPITPATPPSIYLREARHYSGDIPFTLRYLRPREPKHHHAMIAAIGMAQEPEPGVLAIGGEAVMGVHLTLLKPDGSDKAELETPKLIIGQGSTGFPICLAPPKDLLGLAISEGIEDALSIHEATGLGAWAAGCASRMPPLAERVPAWVDCVTVVADTDVAGQKFAAQLHTDVVERRINSDLVTLSALGAAA